jgi:hypothetical protein
MLPLEKQKYVQRTALWTVKKAERKGQVTVRHGLKGELAKDKHQKRELGRRKPQRDCWQLYGNGSLFPCDQ